MDNRSLTEASSYENLIPLFIWDPEFSWESPLGGASAWWLGHSLRALDQEFKKLGRRLILQVGDPASVLSNLISSTNAQAVFWNRLYEEKTLQYDKNLSVELLKKTGRVEVFDSYLLKSPDQVLKKDGTPYLVYTPFYNGIQKLIQVEEPLPKPNLPSLKGDISSSTIENLKLIPLKSWTDGLAENWNPGELGAHKALNLFMDERVAHYKAQRDFPSCEGTSRLSPYLNFGEISITQVLHKLRARKLSKDDQFFKELVWREFSHHLLVHFPLMRTQPLRKVFLKFPWEESPSLFKAWTQGQTGYPIVDAGMRQLWKTGWMHNRVRMIAASFLVKDLLIHWQEGADWFWDTLVDANIASNTQNWQWVAGCGADAAPYFRIFNPTLQGEKFDPEGTYVRTWCPELKRIPKKWIHKPWEAPELVLKESDVILGKTYPVRIVKHDQARMKALFAYERIKKKV